MNRITNKPPSKCRNPRNLRYHRSARVGHQWYNLNDQTRKTESYYERYGPKPFALTPWQEPHELGLPNGFEANSTVNSGVVAAKLKRADGWLMRLIRYLLDRHIHFIVLAAAVIYLGYSWFSVQTKYAQTKGYDFDGIVKLAYGKTLVNFYRDSGNNRPFITTANGDPLVEISDWASSISVNGIRRDLWNTYHTYDLDAKTNKFYHAMTYGPWVLFQEVTVGPEQNHVLVEYFFRSNQKQDEVRLQLGHFNYHFIAPTLGNLGFEAFLSGKNIGEAEQERNVRYKLAMRVNLAAFPDGVAPVMLNEGAKDKFGLTNINANYTLTNVPANERVLVASEDISWEEVAGQNRP